MHHFESQLDELKPQSAAPQGKRVQRRDRLNGNIFPGNPFLSLYSQAYFVGDRVLGHRLAGHALVGSDRFCTLSALLRQARRDELPALLMLGDSSVSGWNSENISPNDSVVRSPFFTYATCSDVLRTRVEAVVINAGVPGYSSFQTLRYAELLFERCRNAGVRVSWTTIYVGNNDGVYTSIADCERITGARAMRIAPGRVSLEDFRTNLECMVTLCRTYGAEPLMLVPPRNLHWPPGRRSKTHQWEFDHALSLLDDCDCRRDLIQAISEYSAGNYLQAAELDRVLPRIKTSYMDELLNVGRNLGASTLALDDSTLTPDLFIDYCHPAPELNMRLAKLITSTLSIPHSFGTGGNTEPHCRLFNAAFNIRLRCASAATAILKRLSRTKHIDRSGDIYPLW